MSRLLFDPAYEITRSIYYKERPGQPCIFRPKGVY